MSSASIINQSSPAEKTFLGCRCRYRQEKGEKDERQRQQREPPQVVRHTCGESEGEGLAHQHIFNSEKKAILCIVLLCCIYAIEKAEAVEKWSLIFDITKPYQLQRHRFYSPTTYIPYCKKRNKLKFGSKTRGRPSGDPGSRKASSREGRETRNVHPISTATPGRTARRLRARQAWSEGTSLLVLFVTNSQNRF